jgi:hypothetical protein
MSKTRHPHTAERGLKMRRARRQNCGKSGLLKLRDARREIEDHEIPAKPDGRTASGAYER